MHWLGISRFSRCPKRGKVIKPPAAPLYLDMGQVPPQPRGVNLVIIHVVALKSR